MCAPDHVPTRRRNLHWQRWMPPHLSCGLAGSADDVRPQQQGLQVSPRRQAECKRRGVLETLAKRLFTPNGVAPTAQTLGDASCTGFWSEGGFRDSSSNRCGPWPDTSPRKAGCQRSGSSARPRLADAARGRRARPMWRSSHSHARADALSRRGVGVRLDDRGDRWAARANSMRSACERDVQSPRRRLSGQQRRKVLIRMAHESNRRFSPFARW